MRRKIALAMSPAKTRHVFDAEAKARLEGLGDILTPQPIEEFGTKEARAALAEAEILISGWGCPLLSRDVLLSAPRLGLIAHAAGTVKYHIDPYAYEAGIAVTNAVAANAVPVAEFTLAAIIFATKRVFDFRDLYRADPSRKSTYQLMDEPIGGYRRTIGIIGASHIGRRLIELLGPFDFDILLTDPFVAPAEAQRLGVELVALENLLRRSDVVSLHAPSLPSTRHMLAAPQLAQMRDGATLINTARGALVNETDLLAELETGRISAIVDVTDPEIPPPDSPWFKLPNVFLTPHIAGAIGTERARLGTLIVNEVERFCRGQPLRHQVAFERLLDLA